jgi:hypothetical protein
MTRLEDLQRFYCFLGKLEERTGGKRLLSQSNGRLAWPRRGVYFFMEEGELRRDSGFGPRIVRVGTHALAPGSQTTLWKRLAQHRGTSRSGGGNHRGSIFRLIVGTALMKRNCPACPSWDDHRSTAPTLIRASEYSLECAVSKTLGAMHFLWLSIDDAPGRTSERGVIERNSIALLSNHGKQPLDPSSPEWLGHCCSRPLVRASGLWNNNHLEENYDPAFLDRLEQLITRAGRS